MDTKVSNKVLLIGFNDAKSLVAKLGLTQRENMFLNGIPPPYLLWKSKKKTLLINNFKFNIFY